jgi:catechol 2,3-dioxygenase-like lactoylglutathione lyase family enzyme
MIRGIDHVAITVANLEAACAFYARVLGASVEEEYEIGGRIAVKRVAFGQAILNIHQQGNGVDLVARQPTPGSVDICFRWEGKIEAAKGQLESRGVTVIEGPVARTTADGLSAHSVYFRDPDGNLVELMAA